MSSEALARVGITRAACSLPRPLTFWQRGGEVALSLGGVLQPPSYSSHNVMVRFAVLNDWVERPRRRDVETLGIDGTRLTVLGRMRHHYYSGFSGWPALRAHGKRQGTRTR